MEALLIKDFLFVFQGIDGFVLKGRDDKYEIFSKVLVSLSWMDSMIYDN